ncbi:MAG: putative DNA binding domain-containing protein [Clostridia bacterium]|nr:putative DNA binding domain-containing protein [Clostridia bacterium]
MQPDELEKLIYDVRKIKSEGQTVELKSASGGVPEKLYDTLSSFSNQDDGGIIVFGINEKDGYNVCGVSDSQSVMKCVSSQCREMEPVVRAVFTVCEIDGKKVVSAEIPGVDIAERPVFYRGVGRVKGSYVRIGDSDEHMTEYEVYSYDVFRKNVRNDVRVVENVQMKLWDKNSEALYLNAVKKGWNNLAQNLNDEEILEMMRVFAGGKPTLAGLLAFHHFPQAYFPQLCITAVSYPGTEIGEEGFDKERFLDNERITGSIQDMLDKACDFVRRNSRTKTIIDNMGSRVDRCEYPLKAVREAILNALVHRDYSVYTERTPIRIEMYRDRMEVVNQGGLYGRTSLDMLGTGKLTPDTRNESLVGILELLGVTENRYSGIPTMRKEFTRVNLPAPVFSSFHGEFRVIFKNSYKCAADAIGSVLEFCQSPKTREEIVGFVGKSQNYVTSKIINPLVKEGKLGLTIPEKPQSSRQKFFRQIP